MSNSKNTTKRLSRKASAAKKPISVRLEPAPRPPDFAERLGRIYEMLLTHYPMPDQGGKDAAA